jgi:hypothetical protein
MVKQAVDCADYEVPQINISGGCDTCDELNRNHMIAKFLSVPLD